MVSNTSSTQRCNEFQSNKNMKYKTDLYSFPCYPTELSDKPPSLSLSLLLYKKNKKGSSAKTQIQQL